jgi:Zn-dependent protease
MLGGFIFGWAKPVPVDWRNLRNPKTDMAWVAAAGPVANLLMLILWALLAKTIMLLGAPATGPWSAFEQMSYAGMMINSVLMILNLFPVPPLDGSRVLSALLPPAMAYKYNRLERYGLLIILVLLMTGYLGRILEPIITGFVSLVALIFGL